MGFFPVGVYVSALLATATVAHVASDDAVMLQLEAGHMRQPTGPGETNGNEANQPKSSIGHGELPIYHEHRPLEKPRPQPTAAELTAANSANPSETREAAHRVMNDVVEGAAQNKEAAHRVVNDLAEGAEQNAVLLPKIGDRVEVVYQGKWQPGTVVAGPAEHGTHKGMWEVHADNDPVGVSTFSQSVHSLGVALERSAQAAMTTITTTGQYIPPLITTATFTEVTVTTTTSTTVTALLVQVPVPPSPKLPCGVTEAPFEPLG